MLHDNAIFGRWFSSSADLSNFDSLVDEYVCAEKQILPNETFAVTWTERTQLSFGSTHWSSTEDSLILENQRAILWRRREADEELYDLVFVALMQSSLLLLCNGIAALLKDKHDVELRPLEIDLNKLTGPPFNERLDGMAIANGKRGRIIVSGLKPLQYPPIPFAFPADDDDPSETFFVSELYLRLGATATDVVLSPDGFLTFTNPHVTVTEIAQCISDITAMIRESS